jgi:hypothetical protein
MIVESGDKDEDGKNKIIVNFMLLDMRKTGKQSIIDKCCYDFRCLGHFIAIGHMIEARRSTNQAIMIATNNRYFIHVINCSRSKIMIVKSIPVSVTPTSTIKRQSTDNRIDILVSHHYDPIRVSRFVIDLT